jgi:hypothetical protein
MILYDKKGNKLDVEYINIVSEEVYMIKKGKNKLE